MKIVSYDECMKVLLNGGFIHEFLDGINTKYELLNSDERIVGSVSLDTWLSLKCYDFCKVNGKGTPGYSTYYRLNCVDIY